MKAARRMAQDGLSSGSFGNVSMADRQHDILAITPSGVLYDAMQAEDICLLHLDGSEIAGAENRYKPSSELPMHCAVYQQRQDVQAIMHTHAAYCTAFASSGKRLGPVIGELGMISPGAVPQVDYFPPGSDALAQQTAQALQEAQWLPAGQSRSSDSGQHHGTGLYAGANIGRRRQSSNFGGAAGRSGIHSHGGKL